MKLRRNVARFQASIPGVSGMEDFERFDLQEN